MIFLKMIHSNIYIIVPLLFVTSSFPCRSLATSGGARARSARGRWSQWWRRRRRHVRRCLCDQSRRGWRRWQTCDVTRWVKNIFILGTLFCDYFFCSRFIYFKNWNAATYSTCSWSHRAGKSSGERLQVSTSAAGVPVSVAVPATAAALFRVTSLAMALAKVSCLKCDMTEYFTNLLPLL